MSDNITMALANADRFIRELKLAVPATNARVVAVIGRHTESVASKAKSAAPHVTGELAGTIRAEYAANGLTGYVKVGLGKLPRRSKAATIAGIARAKGRVRKVGLGAYAPVVERGDPRRHHLPHPFLQPAFEADKPTAITDIDHALNDSMAAIT